MEDHTCPLNSLTHLCSVGTEPGGGHSHPTGGPALGSLEPLGHHGTDRGQTHPLPGHHRARAHPAPGPREAMAGVPPLGHVLTPRVVATDAPCGEGSTWRLWLQSSPKGGTKGNTAEGDTEHPAPADRTAHRGGAAPQGRQLRALPPSRQVRTPDGAWAWLTGTQDGDRRPLWASGREGGAFPQTSDSRNPPDPPPRPAGLAQREALHTPQSAHASFSALRPTAGRLPEPLPGLRRAGRRASELDGVPGRPPRSGEPTAGRLPVPGRGAEAGGRPVHTHLPGSPSRGALGQELPDARAHEPRGAGGFRYGFAVQPLLLAVKSQFEKLRERGEF